MFNAKPNLVVSKQPGVGEHHAFAIIVMESNGIPVVAASLPAFTLPMVFLDLKNLSSCVRIFSIKHVSNWHSSYRFTL